MPAADLVLSGGTVVTAAGRFRADVVIKDGRITGLTSGGITPSATEVVDVSGSYILPGIIDSHVHLRYPGNPGRETFATGTRAAAAGGVTTILEHPISDPAVHTADIFRARVEVCDPEAYVDYALFGAAGEENVAQIQGLAQAGAVAFKTFLHAAPEGREREFKGLTVTNEGALCDVLAEVAATGRLAAVHAESNAIIEHRVAKLRAQGRKDITAHHDSRPVLAELVSISGLLEMADAVGARLLICHISGGSVASYLREARERGYEVLVETCPHYLFLSTDETPALGPYARINPPIRSPQEQEQLWEEMYRGTVDFIGSDHGPFLPAEKDPGWEDIWPVPCGAVGIETMLPLMLDAVADQRLDLEHLAHLMSENIAHQFGLWPRKGCISPGSDADLTVVRLGEEETVCRDRMQTRSRDSALLYDGWTLQGRVDMTVVRGQVVFREGKIVGREGFGQLVIPAEVE